MIEAIARQYITGSMWRDYSKGGREFCGITIGEGLKKDTKLPELLVTLPALPRAPLRVSMFFQHMQSRGKQL
jgi:phosphoribosylaminoimidazole-succinocarboxamide synthase